MSRISRTTTTESYRKPRALALLGDLSAEQVRERIAEWVEAIIAKAARRVATGLEPLGAAAILRQHPFTQPAKTKRSPAPLVHAATKRARTEVAGFQSIESHGVGIFARISSSTGEESWWSRTSLAQKQRGQYLFRMSPATAHLLEEFDRLPLSEQRELSAVIVNRAAQLDDGNITDEELTASASRIFEITVPVPFLREGAGPVVERNRVLGLLLPQAKRKQPVSAVRSTASPEQ